MRMRLAWAALMVFAAMAVSGCDHNKGSRASILAQTTLPAGFNISVVNLAKPKTFYPREQTDIAGNVRFFGLEPGRYKLVYQAVTGATRPTDTGYNYGESEPIDIKAGRNTLNWSVETGSVSRLDE